MSSDNELFDRVGDVLLSRPGWIYEPSTTPGAPPSWCLDSHGEIKLSVGVDHGAITVYLPNQDQEIAVDDLDGLTTWIEANEARFLQP
jgi:hypothetical protein